MKRIFKYTLILLIVFILLPINASAKTVAELKRELSDLESQFSSNEGNLKATEEEIAAAKERVQSIYGELEEADKEIQAITAEIAKLNQEINEKDKQTKELMKFFQVSEGESTYLEYIFKADSITDFIYRVSVTEQLSAYNDKLMDEMNQMIEENNRNIDELHKKEQSLKDLQKELNEKLVVLASERDDLYEVNLSLKDEVEAQQEILNYYIKAGCNDSDDISTCAGNDLPPGTKFWRPLSTGCMTDNYGWRFHPIYSVWRLHTGIDMSCGDHRVYSISDGKVGYVNYGYGGGYGNYVVVHHMINGKKYSSLYAHLSSINVSMDQIVTKDTLIGIMGSTGDSTGTHLHLNVYTGHYLKLGETASLVDPRDYINFPSYYDGGPYTYFYDRTSYYN